MASSILDQRAKRTAAFLRGRDLAADLLDSSNACDAFAGMVDRVECDGETQVNFVLPYLQRLAAEPELVEGFAAVLSDVLNESIYEPERYRRLTAEQMGVSHA